VAEQRAVAGTRLDPRVLSPPAAGRLPRRRGGGGRRPGDGRRATGDGQARGSASAQAVAEQAATNPRHSRGGGCWRQCGWWMTDWASRRQERGSAGRESESVGGILGLL